jgi:hypothetical protein
MQKKVETSIAQTLDFLGVTQRDIKSSVTLELPHGYVTYDAWREKNIAKVLVALQAQDIHSCGRFGAWKYSSMQEAFVDGRDVATLVLSKKMEVFYMGRAFPPTTPLGQAVSR